ncbi:hypothetical protein KFZ56_07795 [Virgibacillus sp. NKC19-3]|uniref:hypothetical protein n=1 Tax=Virgibacillus saliphilus TaxID=2831674 RepID=UPI001C9AEF05|nr:hypothetical protein [Virgibacillus sp. NKC19-3]MBY7142961.1 hypothetical protein [Virgibacillus sp. NKC19-3]
MEALPKGLWAMYYLILLLTLISAIYSCFRFRMLYWAYTCIIVSLLIPIVGLLFIAQRAEGTNKLGYLFSQLAKGDFWAVLIILCLAYIGTWWFLFIREEINMDVIIRRLQALRETVKKCFYKLNNKIGRKKERS